MNSTSSRDYILGVDLGTNSLGWALVDQTDGRPTALFQAGVRIFDAAMDGDIESGQEESKNRARREARLHRRQVWRRARRLAKTFRLLQRFGLLPEGAVSSPLERQDAINHLDSSLVSSDWFTGVKRSGLYPQPDQVLPYILRARALDEPLEPYMLGRAFYHLAQRRGFLSNRKQMRKTEKDEDGVVKKAIGELSVAIHDSGARTLGEFLARCSPFEKRIRARWTARSMYVEEFGKIWEAQTRFHPDLLTESRRELLFRTIFHQRPLKFDPNVIGRCELEPGQPRASAYLLASQRFRLLDRVNSLAIIPPGETECPLTPKDRAKLIDALEIKGDMTFKQVRKLLGLTKEYLFNLERGGEEKIPGNRIAEQFHDALGQRWVDMTTPERNSMVEYVHAFEKPGKLKNAAQKKWGLDEQQAAKLADISLEPDYLRLSRKAIDKVLPLLEQGLPYATARKRIYPDSFKANAPLDLLPPVTSFAEIRNPAVIRGLTELRKVVNGIILRHGKPSEIHIELARDLKKPRKAREMAWKRNRDIQKARLAAAKRIVEEVGVPRPSRTDIRKYLLAEECGWHCPYTNQPISMRTLFSEPQFDIEHIIPFSRSLDDSFLNVTLCSIQENRNNKGNKTPFEAYSSDPARYQEIQNRVAKFTGERGTTAEKLRRFRMAPDEVQKLLSDFTSRQLSDTAYASTLAAEYLGSLYGGVVDAGSKRRVQATSGKVTAFLRNEWQLNGILGDGPSANGGATKKTRDDHRHHAVDAATIALTDAASVKMLSDAAQRAPSEHRRRFASLPAPWPRFVDSVREQIEKIVVSHRVSKKISGALHEETIYGVAADSSARRSVRKPLSSVSVPEIEDIAEPSVRRLVQAKLESLGGGEPKRLFSDDKNLPHFETHDGRRIPIKRVRITKPVPTFSLGDGRSRRHVASESNHHIEIFAELDEDGREVEWDGLVVPLAEAYRRKKEGQPVVQRDHGAHREFKFSLAPKEIVECNSSSGQRSLFVVRKMTHFTSGGIQIGFAPVNDARQARDMQTSRAWLWSSPDKLRKRNARKVTVSPLGEVNQAHD